MRYEDFEIFPHGSKSETATYRKQIDAARAIGIPLDGALVHRRPELLTGWSLRPVPVRWIACPTIVAVAVHLHYRDVWPEIETLLLGWSVPFRLFVTMTSDDCALADRVRSVFPGSEAHCLENRGRDVRPFLLHLEAGVFDGFDVVNGRTGDPAVYVEELFESAAVLFDLGDLSNLPTRKIQRLEHVFVSHAHVDHFFGFDRVLRVLVGHEKTIRLYGPENFIACVAHKLAAYTE